MIGIEFNDFKNSFQHTNNSINNKKQRKLQQKKTSKNSTIFSTKKTLNNNANTNNKKNVVYEVKDVWKKKIICSNFSKLSDAISFVVKPHAVVMLKITPIMY
jgi:hypothetical protein